MSRFDIAATLKRLRAKSGLTADEVGLLIGKTGKTVNGWEHGRGQPDADILIKLADIYHVENLLVEFGAKKQKPFVLSDHERKVIFAYRSKPDMQSAVDTLLNIQDDVEREKEKRA